MLSRKIAVAALVSVAMTIGMSTSFASELTQRVHHGWKHSHAAKTVKMERKHMRKSAMEHKNYLKAKEAKFKHYMHH